MARDVKAQNTIAQDANTLVSIGQSTWRHQELNLGTICMQNFWSHTKLSLSGYFVPPLFTSGMLEIAKTIWAF